MVDDRQGTNRGKTTMLNRVMIGLALLGLSVAGLRADKSPEPPVATPKVRALKATRPLFKQLGGKNKVMVAKTAAELDKLLGKVLATELGKQVKFATEQVVIVSYQTSGPTFGILKHEVKGKDKKTVEFYVQEPKGVPRGQALKLGLEYFAVTKGTPVKYAGTK